MAAELNRGNRVSRTDLERHWWLPERWCSSWKLFVGWVSLQLQQSPKSSKRGKPMPWLPLDRCSKWHKQHQLWLTLKPHLSCSYHPWFDCQLQIDESYQSRETVTLPISLFVILHCLCHIVELADFNLKTIIRPRTADTATAAGNHV